MVGEAQGNGCRVHPHARWVRMDRRASAGHALPSRQASAAARASPPGNFTLPRMSARYHRRRVGENSDGRVVAFEPNPEIFTQYFFVATPDFEAAGVASETASAIEQRLSQIAETCAECSRPATWLWMSREQVASLDETDKIRERARRMVLLYAWRAETGGRVRRNRRGQRVLHESSVR